MRTHAAFVTALGFALSVFACAAGTSDETSGTDGNADTGNEQDITKSRSELAGSWVVTTDSKDLTSSVAYELRPNGQFWRDDNKVFNGVLVKGAPQPVQRTAGHFTLDTAKKTITFHVDAGPQKGLAETLSYTYAASKILNGVFLPGHAPDTRAHLTLVGIPAPGSHVAYPAIEYAREDSWCTSDKDCDDERADGTWKPMSVPPGAGLGPYVPPSSVCDTTARTCSASLTKN